MGEQSTLLTTNQVGAVNTPHHNPGGEQSTLLTTNKVVEAVNTTDYKPGGGAVDTPDYKPGGSSQHY